MNKLIQTKKYNKKFNAFAGLEFMKKNIVSQIRTVKPFKLYTEIT